MKIKNYLQSLTVALMGLFSIQNSGAVEEQYTIYELNSVHDKWFGRFDNRTAVNNEMLKVGGSDDVYYTMIRMPSYLPVPPRILLIRAQLHLYSYGSVRPTSMRKYFVKSNWTETSTSDQFTVPLQDVGTTLTPPVNGDFPIDISAEFGTWITGGYGNFGILLSPENTDNRFNNFLSSENSREFGRPKIVIDYERLPNFKMPLPGGKAWKLTVEAGGKEYDTQNGTDVNHTGNTLYSLDFSPSWVSLTDGSQGVGVDVPIYAAASGKVYEVAANTNNPNGWYVRIDHDSDTAKANTGFQTVYIHLKNQPLVSVGQVVRQGQQIGIMGTTGIKDGVPTSTAVHLHMTFYYKGVGGLDIMNYDSAYLNALRMENRAIRNYKLSTTWRTDLSPNQWSPLAYPSSNTQ